LIENTDYDEDIGFLTESQEMTKKALNEDIINSLNKNNVRGKRILLQAFLFRRKTRSPLGV
jgi:hypothetical protein